MAKVQHTVTGCIPIDKAIIEAYVQLINTDKVVNEHEDDRQEAEGQGDYSDATAYPNTRRAKEAVRQQNELERQANEGTSEDERGANTRWGAEKQRQYNESVRQAAEGTPEDEAGADTRWGAEKQRQADELAREHQAGEDHTQYGLDHGASVAATERANNAAAAAEHQVDVKRGYGIASVTEPVVATTNGGVNTIRVTTEDNRTYDFYVRNGKSSEGLFATAADLPANPSVGDYAFVGADFPADIYICATAGVWTDSGNDYDGDSVDLTNYATKDYVSVSQNSQTIEIGGEEVGALGGVYEAENPEWAKVVTDADGHLVMGIRHNGSTYARKLESETFDEKVDREEGKELIPSRYIEDIENPEYLQVKTDSEGHIAEGLQKNGTKEFGGKVKAKEVSIDSADYSNAISPEYISVEVDMLGHISAGTKKDGSHYIREVQSESIKRINNRLAVVENRFKPYIDLDGKGIAVGDAYTMTSLSCPHLKMDDVTGICYATWMMHPTSYGEEHGYLSLTMFPGTQPFNCESFSIASIGDTDEDNAEIDTPYESNCLIYYLDEDRREPIVRCFFSTHGEYLYYRDFNPLTKQFLSKAKKIHIINDSDVEEVFTGTKAKTWANAHGGNWVKNWRLLFTDYIETNKSVWGDGDYIYSVITSDDEDGTPLIVKSDDNFATIKFVAVNPTHTRYECQISKLGDRFYFLNRVKDVGVVFNTSTDLENYTTTYVVPYSLTERSQILNHGNALYLVVPTSDCPDPVGGSRMAYHIYKGTGSNFNQYEDILWFVNRFGLVYISANFSNGRLLMCYSTNMLMLGNPSVNEGKSTGMFHIVENYYN